MIFLPNVYLAVHKKIQNNEKKGDEAVFDKINHRQ